MLVRLHTYIHIVSSTYIVISLYSGVGLRCSGVPSSQSIVFVRFVWLVLCALYPAMAHDGTVVACWSKGIDASMCTKAA